MSSSPASSRRKPGSGAKRAARGTLNKPIIVDAAIELINESGLESFTTRRLSDALGVQAMSLYTHFRDKTALLDAVSLELLGRLVIPSRIEDDIEWLRELMRAYFQLLIDYPYLIEMDAILGESNTAEIEVSEQIYACLLRLRIPVREAVGRVAGLTRFVLGCALVYPTRRAWDEDPQHWERFRMRFQALPDESFPALHSLTDDFPIFTQIDVFNFGLDLLLAQLETRVTVDNSGEASPQL